jgi:hypothetical protein
MHAIDRRRFLAGLGHGGAALAASSLLDTIGYVQVARRSALDSSSPGARMTFRLPPRSYTVAQLAVTA